MGGAGNMMRNMIYMGLRCNEEMLRAILSDTRVVVSHVCIVSDVVLFWKKIIIII